MDTLLTGNFIREGDDLRITCQLVDVKTRNILWKGEFDHRYQNLSECARPGCRKDHPGA